MKKKPEPNKQKQPVEYINGRRVEYVPPLEKSMKLKPVKSVGTAEK